MLFSIIICTYNPQERLLKRVIQACLNQTFSDFEIVLVDNNSFPSLKDLEWVKTFGNRFRIVTEIEQGLVFARLAGFKASAGEILVFADDDNILSEDYLANAISLLQTEKNVGIWGPGIIELEYPDGVPGWIDKFYSGLYQKKQFDKTQTGAEIEWQDFYPAGSGMIVKRTVFNEYQNLFYSGKISATGRKGESLASAEDSQLVWTAIKMGFKAGTAPVLKLIHIIPGKRTNSNYLKKLNYGMSASYYRALTEMFPDFKLPYKKRSIPGKLKLALKLFIKAGLNPILFRHMYEIENAWPRAYEDFLKSERVN